MSLQHEFDVQRVVAAMKAELNLDNPGSIEEKHARELAEYTVQLARVQAELEQVKAQRDAALSNSASNPKFQKLQRAAQLRAEAAALEQQAL